MSMTLIVSLLATAFDKLGGVFVAKEGNRVSKSRLVAGLAIGLVAGCAIHARSVQEFATCVNATTGSVVSLSGAIDE